MKAVFGLFSLAAFLCLIAYGWIHNIVMICHTDAFSGMLVARVIGVFAAPLGVVLGFF